jgi:hypothetical protein
MKTKFLVLLVVSLAASRTLQAAQTATVEDRKAFVKIIDAQRPDAPANRDAPDVLFIRKSDIVRIMMVFSGHHTDYRVLVVTYGADVDRRAPEGRALTDSTSTYAYTFPTEASATAFCEALLAK